MLLRMYASLFVVCLLVAMESKSLIDKKKVSLELYRLTQS